ncbi:protein-tyrosine kinase 6 isoform X2 [Heterocephalus glaber]|uniref:non-specific protein-tyrosine kinase n=1 Tax=Heterocephalus glaber TaxID=10181 RepID=A0AAX6SN90_HETGA|nr:protein-tyrosine kinase 6 isoform X2 [Heterocephalus glaber]
MASQGQPHSGPKYMGLWDFEARTDEELSFRAGDLFHVARKEDQWWWATLLDDLGQALEEGYVPHNYLVEKETMESEPAGCSGCAALQDLAAQGRPAAPERGSVLLQPAGARGLPQGPEPAPWPAADCALLEGRAARSCQTQLLRGGRHRSQGCAEQGWGGGARSPADGA